VVWWFSGLVAVIRSSIMYCTVIPPCILYRGDLPSGYGSYYYYCTVTMAKVLRLLYGSVMMRALSCPCPLCRGAPYFISTTSLTPYFSSNSLIELRTYSPFPIASLNLELTLLFQPPHRNLQYQVQTLPLSLLEPTARSSRQLKA
jgi:hypothetical protein